MDTDAAEHDETQRSDAAEDIHEQASEEDKWKTLKYHLLGPSLTKAGQDKVDQSKVRG